MAAEKLKAWLTSNRNSRPGVIIIGNSKRPYEDYGMRVLTDGKIGIWDMKDPNNIMSILDLKNADGVLATMFGYSGIYYEDPTNEWYGHFFDKVPVWKELEGRPGFYWNTTGDANFKGQLYEHKFSRGIHIMAPTGIKWPVVKWPK